MKKNVAIVITRLDLGGAQKVALELFQNLDRKKFNVHLIAGRGGYLDKTVVNPKTGTVRLWDEIKHPISPLNDIKAAFKLARYFRENKIDIVNTHSSKAGILGRTAARLAGIENVFHTVHGFSFHPNQNPLMHFLYLLTEWAFAPYTKKFIAVGEDVKNYGLKNTVGTPGQYKVIRAAVDTKLFSVKRNSRAVFLKKYGLKPEYFTVGMIGNLKKQKNAPEFIRIANMACAAQKDIQFIFAGGGEGKVADETRRVLASGGYEKRIKLAGWVDRPEEFMSSIDVFMLTSLWEGLACTLVQAYCAGIPLAATDIPGNSEFINLTRAGHLYKAGDTKAACDLLHKLRESRRKIRPSGKILREFGSREMVKLYELEFTGIKA